MPFTFISVAGTVLIFFSILLFRSLVTLGQVISSLADQVMYIVFH